MSKNVTFFRREEYIKEISEKLSGLQLQIQNLNALHLFDINTISEDFICGLLNIMCRYSLSNLNKEKSNYPGIDLGSKSDGIAVQVTSDGSSNKIKKTIGIFESHRLYEEYPRLLIIVLGSKPSYRTEFDTQGTFSFDKDKDIVDIMGLIEEINCLSETSHIEEIYHYILSETEHIHAKEELSVALGSTQKKVQALFRSRLSSIGVPERAIDILWENDLKSDKYNYIVEANKNYLVGEYGIGKSHAMHILYMQYYNAFCDGTSEIIPLFATARDIVYAKGIQKIAGEEVLDDNHIFILIDGLDEVDYREISRIHDEIGYMNERYKNVRILVATRELPIIDQESCVKMHPLDDEQIDQIYKDITGDDKRVSFHRRYSYGGLDYMMLLNRPFFLLLYAVYASPDNRLINNDIDMVSLFLEKTIGKQKLESEKAYDQLIEIAIHTINKGMGSVHASEISFDVEYALKTGLVTEEAGQYYAFQLPIVAQWLAALALKGNRVDIDGVLKNKRMVMRWRYPLSIWFSFASFESSKALLSVLVVQYPGVAGLIISEGTRRGNSQHLENAAECGEKIQFCMDSWVRGLGKTAELLKVSNNGYRPNDLYVNTYERQLMYSWSDYKQGGAIITEDFSGVDRVKSGLTSATSKVPPAQSTWPWVITFEELKTRLKKLIRNRRIPVHGQLQRELVWKQALKNKSPLLTKSIPLSELPAGVLQDDLLRSFVYDQKVFFKELNKLKSEGVAELVSPYPVGDLDLPNGSYIWDAFSREQMRKRIQFEFTTGIAEYVYIVEHFFPCLKNEMALYAVLPAKLIGQLEFEKDNSESWTGGPLLSWYMLPLPKGEDSEVAISYDNKVDFNDEQLWAELKKALNQRRSDNREFVFASMHSGLVFNNSCTPVTDWVYEKLKSDLKAISWFEK